MLDNYVSVNYYILQVFLIIIPKLIWRNTVRQHHVLFFYL